MAPLRLLYVAHMERISIFSRDPTSGALSHLQDVAIPPPTPDTAGAIHGLALGKAGRVMYLATGSALLSFDVDQVSGGLTKASECALPVEDFSNFISLDKTGPPPHPTPSRPVATGPPHTPSGIPAG